MAKSQKVTLVEASNGTVTATTKDAEVLDIITTAFSTDTVVTGMIGLLQRAAFFAGGMALNNQLKQGTPNFLK